MHKDFNIFIIPKISIYLKLNSRIVFFYDSYSF